MNQVIVDSSLNSRALNAGWELNVIEMLDDHCGPLDIL